MQMNRGASLTVRLTENPGYSEFTPQGKINPRLFNHWFHFHTEQWGMQVSEFSVKVAYNIHYELKSHENTIN